MRVRVSKRGRSATAFSVRLGRRGNLRPNKEAQRGKNDAVAAAATAASVVAASPAADTASVTSTASIRKAETTAEMVEWGKGESDSI